jgi:hypothetical protein
MPRQGHSEVRQFLTRNWEKHAGRLEEAKLALERADLSWTSDGALKGMLRAIANDPNRLESSVAIEEPIKKHGLLTECSIQTDEDGSQYVAVPVSLSFGDFYEHSFCDLVFVVNDKPWPVAEIVRYYLVIKDGEGLHPLDVSDNGGGDWYHGLGKRRFPSAIVAAASALSTWREYRAQPTATARLYPRYAASAN